MIPMSNSSPARVTARIGGDFMKEDSTHYIVDMDVDHSRRRRGSESSSSSHEPEPNNRRVPRSERSERFLDTLSQSATMATQRAETMTMLRDDELPFRSRRRDPAKPMPERKDTVLPRDTDYDLRSRPRMSDASRLQVQQSAQTYRPGAKTNMVCMPMDNSYPMHDYSKSGRLHTASGGRRGRQASGGEPLAKAKSLSPKRLITSLFSKKNSNQ